MSLETKAAASASERRRRAGTALIFLVCLAPVFVTPVMPLVDFYDHLARYFVLAHADVDPVIGRNYAPAWGLLPNLGMDVIGVPLMRVLDPYVVARVLAVLLMAVQFGGVLALNRALFGRTSLMTAALSGALLYSYIFVWGFSNFLLGLGLAFIAAAWWVRMRDRPKIALPVSILFSLAIFFAHGFAFFIYGLLVGGLELGAWLETSPRKPAALMRTAGLLLLQAVGPALIFLGTRTAAGQAPAAAGLAHPAGVLPRLTWEARHRLHAIVQVADGPSLAFDLLCGAVVLTAIGLLLRRGAIRLARPALAPLAIFGLLVLVMPPAAIGVDYLADRLPLVCAMLVAAALAPTSAYPTGTDGLWLGALAARIAAVGLAWAAYGQAFADYRQVVRPIGAGDLVRGVVVSSGDPREAEPRCEMYRPLTVIDRRAAAPLFALGTQQPLRLAGRLAWAETPETPIAKRDDVDWSLAASDRIAQVAAEARFDYLLLCGQTRLKRPLPDSLAPVGARGDLALYRIRKPRAAPRPLAMEPRRLPAG